MAFRIPSPKRYAFVVRCRMHFDRPKFVYSHVSMVAFHYISCGILQRRKPGEATERISFENPKNYDFRKSVDEHQSIESARRTFIGNKIENSSIERASHASKRLIELI